MKIQSIQNYNATKNQKKLKTNTFNSKPIGTNSSKCSFTACVDGTMNAPLVFVNNWRKAKILERTKAELVDLAEYFHKASDETIDQVCGSEKFGYIFSKEKFNLRFNKLNEALKIVKSNRLKTEKEIFELETKKANSLGNITEQKDRINRQFISLLNSEKKGENPPITNGILIYGPSADKEGFIDWLANASGSVIKRFKHDENNPIKTIENIVDTAEKSETAFQHSNARTLLIVDGLDKMLTNHDNLQGVKMIARFKGFVEHMSKDYHTTIVTKTDQPLEAFEEASIGPNRFGIKVDLKGDLNGLPQKDTDRLDELKKEIERLDDKAEQYGKFHSYYAWPE